MSKIVVKHSRIEINNYEQGDSPRLERMFSIYDMVYHRLFYKGLLYDKEEKKLIIPRGMDIFLLEKTFCEDAEVDYNSDPYEFNEKIMLKYLPRDEVQKKALKFLLGEGEYTSTKNKSQLSLNLNTGAGKTYITFAYLAFTRVKGIIITSSINWLEQWKKCASEYTDIAPNEVCFISGSSHIQSLLNRDLSKYKLFLVSHNTLKSYGDNHGWDKIEELFKCLKVGVKVYDEAHLNFDNICDIDFNTNTKKTLYLTATPARSDTDENKIYKLAFKNVPAIDLFDQDKDPRTNYIALRYNSRPTPQEQSSCANRYGFDRNKYTSYITERENFQMILHVVMDMITKCKGKALVYIGTNVAINSVYRWIMFNYPEYRGRVGVYTSLVTENKEEQLAKTIILSTTKSCGAAIDIKDLKVTVVLAEPFKSEVLARQTLGRTRSSNTFYIDIIDDGFAATRRYYLKKLPIFEKYAKKCSEVRFTDVNLLDRVDKIHDSRRGMKFLFTKCDKDGNPLYGE